MNDFLPIRGRRPRQAAAVLDRELTLEDVQSLAVQGDSKPVELVKIREHHHALARALASGCTPAEAAAITGYSSSRISILQADPAFADLMELYRRDAQADFAIIQSRKLDVYQKVLDKMEQAVDAYDPEEGDLKALKGIGEFVADRLGDGPSAKSTNVNVNLDLSDRLKAARDRAGLLALPGPKEPVV